MADVDDKDTNGLPGMLPLAIGMRVALFHKVDESPEKRLLKHSVGRVHSWVWEDGAPHPSIIYLKFESTTWKLDGIDEPGVHPVKLKKLTWYLDNKRQKKGPEGRAQPVAPRACISHDGAFQPRKTLRAVLLDLSVDKRVDTNLRRCCCQPGRQPSRLLDPPPFRQACPRARSSCCNNFGASRWTGWATKKA